MKVLRKVGGCALGVVVPFLVIALVIAGMRAYNQRVYPIMAVVRGGAEGGFDGASASISPVHGEYLNGFHLQPQRRQHEGVVVTYGGSEGSPNYERATQLANAGYEVLALYFFGQDNQAPTLANVPLEQFEEVSDYIRANVAEPDPVTVIGNSKGAEFALLLAQHGFAVDNVVAFAPAHYSYSGLDFSSGKDLPTFTLRGEAVPFASFRNASVTTGLRTMWHSVTSYPVSYLATYEEAAANAPDSARIELSLIDVPVVLFAGAADQMWQSATAAEALCASGPSAECHIYPDAGHVFLKDAASAPGGWELMFGGTPEGNRAAYEDSEQVLAERLAQWHPNV